MWVHTGAPRGRLVHSGCHGFPRACLAVAAFIQVCLAYAVLKVGGFTLVRHGSHERDYMSSGSYGLECRPVYWPTRGFIHAGLGEFGFIRFRVGSLGRA